jgi:hypothetical protein
MPRTCLFYFAVLILFSLTETPMAWASSATRLTTGDALVTVYSGPGFRFRPIVAITKKTELVASSRIYQGKDGEFYKVLVVFKNGRKQIGYVSVLAPVDLSINSNAKAGDDDIDTYKDLALAESAMQVGFHTLKNTKVFWTLGYLKYPAPSFYIKGLVGQLLSETASSLMVGGEVGTDHFLSNTVSIYTSLASGSLIVPREDLVFEGSKNFNMFLQGGTGFRFNAEFAAVSLGALQAVLFNQNNSFISWGLGMTLEVGL